ncbi:MAG: DUF134 domain-containing protein [Pseudomonadota bacterium]
MPRPRKCRRVSQHPAHRIYKPQGVPGHELSGIKLPVEGFEALRLADAEGLEHLAAAEMMGISRPTFSRMLTEAHKIVAFALTNGWAIHIEGGHFEVVDAIEPADDWLRRGRRRRTGGQ